MQGGQAVAERLVSHPSVAAVSFVGSSPVAAAVYRGAAEHGKRCQALGGAKNHLIVMPDADLKRAVPALIGSCFGCAGQRCLAGSVIAPVGSRERQDAVVAAFVAAAAALRLGSGLDAATTLPPLYSAEHRDRVAAWVERAVADGATLALDGRGAAQAAGLERGAFLGACVLDECTPAMPLGGSRVGGWVSEWADGQVVDVPSSSYEGLWRCTRGCAAVSPTLRDLRRTSIIALAPAALSAFPRLQ